MSQLRSSSSNLLIPISVAFSVCTVSFLFTSWTWYQYSKNKSPPPTQDRPTTDTRDSTSSASTTTTTTTIRNKSSSFLYGRWFVSWWSTTVSLYRRYRNDPSKQSKTTTTTTPIVACPVEGFPIPLWEAFQRAAEMVASSSSGNLTDGDRLLLYGLYKQVTVGDATDPNQNNNNGRGGGGRRTSSDTVTNYFVNRAKFQAWTKMKGMSREQAALHYIAAVTEFFPSATTTTTTKGEEEEEVLPSQLSSLRTDDTTYGETTTAYLAPMGVSRPLRTEHHDDDDEGKEEEDTRGSGDGSTVQSKQGPSPDLLLLRAAGNADVRTLTSLLDGSFQVNETGGGGGVANVNYSDETGMTALHLAADKGSESCVQVLLQHGANPNAADQDGITVLQTAVIAGKVPVCRILLQAGADPDQPDQMNDTARSSAAESDSDEMKALFEITEINEEINSS